jgi:RNA recognition motif-containing protein
MSQQVEALEPIELRRLFVRNLSFATRDDAFSALFSQYGQVLESSIRYEENPENPQLPRSKGYGFVVFKYAADAQKALQQPDKWLHGRLTHSHLACIREVSINPEHREN